MCRYPGRTSSPRGHADVILDAEVMTSTHTAALGARVGEFGCARDGARHTNDMHTGRPSLNAARGSLFFNLKSKIIEPSEPACPKWQRLGRVHAALARISIEWRTSIARMKVDKTQPHLPRNMAQFQLLDPAWSYSPGLLLTCQGDIESINPSFFGLQWARARCDSYLSTPSEE